MECAVRTKTTTLALITAAVIAAGCMVPDDPGDPGVPGAAPEQGTSAPGESLEGQFDREGMDQYVNAVVPMITEYMQETWPDMPLPEVVYVPDGYTGREGCIDQSGQQATATSASYEYCPVDQAVYVGQDMLWEFYTRTGDAGPAVGLAHEFGHHVQSELGATLENMSSVDIENQADCIAGAWTRFTDERGWLEREDDLKDIETLFPLIGSAEDPTRDHGTTQERAASFEAGFTGGVGACGL
jgi:predicted metalloprotease